ncbi:hypothetical protein RRG08_028200 [Elysia crispata]|uniref:Uncharacterized protein n=1 Tax=Elysia crispata TaxID=231223 RepID=A0AAE1B917_9GAST|nr:hypothetical protein RRG08_028200 [Elysia crispata]
MINQKLFQTSILIASYLLLASLVLMYKGFLPLKPTAFNASAEQRSFTWKREQACDKLMYEMDQYLPPTGYVVEAPRRYSDPR